MFETQSLETRQVWEPEHMHVPKLDYQVSGGVRVLSWNDTTVANVQWKPLENGKKQIW